ncbi:MAG: hypothetical protein ACREF4_04725 [Gammaproteobacteria bacterium]
MTVPSAARGTPFSVDEVTIDELHAAIRAGSRRALRVWKSSKP